MRSEIVGKDVESPMLFESLDELSVLVQIHLGVPDHVILLTEVWHKGRQSDNRCAKHSTTREIPTTVDGTVDLGEVNARVSVLVVGFDELGPCRGESFAVDAIRRGVLDEPATERVMARSRECLIDWEN